MKAFPAGKMNAFERVIVSNENESSKSLVAGGGKFGNGGFFITPRDNWFTRWEITSGELVPGAKRLPTECFPYRDSECCFNGDCFYNNQSSASLVVERGEIWK